MEEIKHITGVNKSPIITKYAIEAIQHNINTNNGIINFVFLPNAKYAICEYVIAPVLLADDTNISNEKSDAIALIYNNIKPNNKPQRDTANGNDNTPPPTIVDTKLNTATRPDCCLRS